MSRNVRTLAELSAGDHPRELSWPAYPREALGRRIVHIGVGGFHRAHQARYLDDYLGASGDLAWGVCGIGLMPGDDAMLERLDRQNGLYTLIEKDDSGRSSRVIGSLGRVIFAPDNRSAAIAALADPDVSIISMTITEGGYRYDFEKDAFHSDHPDIQHDLHNPELPRTSFGYLWQACRQRSSLGERGRVTLLSCDNVPHNGDVLRKAMLAFIELAEPDLLPWFERSVTFPNSMVDRITPAPEASDQRSLREELGVEDDCALGCERFIQWVIEDRFAAGRPALEEVGVQFTEDVDPYEKTKLRLLNGSHLMMGFVGYLAGYQRVDHAIEDPAIRRLVRDYMRFDAAPTLPHIEAIDLSAYQDQLIERFGNSQIGDQQMRICSDGYAKLKNYVMPLVWDRLATGEDSRRLSFLFASFLAYLNGIADDGTSLTIVEYNLSEEENRLTRADRVALLRTDAFFGRVPDAGASAFLDAVGQWYASIEERGAYATLKILLETD